MNHSLSQNTDNRIFQLNFELFSTLGKFRNGEPLGDMDEGFDAGTEITFNCIKGAAGERTTWKIICEDGVWTGRSFECGKIFYTKLSQIGHQPRKQILLVFFLL